MTPYGFRDLSQHWFKQCLIACIIAFSFYLIQFLVIDNWTTRNKFNWNLDQYAMCSIFENVICKMADISTSLNLLTHCDLRMAYGDIDLG